MSNLCRTTKQMNGAVLAIALIILFVMTLIGVTALQTTTLEERISKNLNDSAVAMQSADTALREAERYIESLTDATGFGTSNGLYSNGNAPDPFTASTWTGTNSIVGTAIPGTNTPRYYIEVIGDYGGGTNINVYNYGQDPRGGNVTVFRIVARGTGSSGAAEVTLESFYGKRF